MIVEEKALLGGNHIQGQVLIRLYATLRRDVGKPEVRIDLDGRTSVWRVLQTLVQEYPELQRAIWAEDGTLAGHVSVLLNGRNVLHLDGLETTVDGNDELHIFPPIGGGTRSKQPKHVSIRFGGDLHRRVPSPATDFAFQGSTLRDLLFAIVEAFDLADELLDDGIPKPYLQMVVNGRLWYAVGAWDALIEDGSTLSLFIFGGALPPVRLPHETTVPYLQAKRNRKRKSNQA